MKRRRASRDARPSDGSPLDRAGTRGGMTAVVWHGKRDVRVDDVADPVIEQPDDAIVRITSSGLCGSVLHL